MNYKVPHRYKLLVVFASVFLILSTVTRVAFYIWSFEEIDFSLISLLRIIFTGLFFDVGTISYFLLPYILYLLFLPNKYCGSLFDKIITHFAYFVGLITFVFTTFAEFTFWEEFQNRFNFISVDYLIYTSEVIQNINQSYNVPISLSVILGIVFLIIYLSHKKQYFYKTFYTQISLKEKIPFALLIIFIFTFFSLFIKNESAEWSDNRYENELSKAGIYSFFAAFKNNELSYPNFYLTKNVDDSFKKVKQYVIAENMQLATPNKYSFKRKVINEGEELKPNVIFICIESFSAEFLKRYGSRYNMAPHIDSLIPKCISFTNLYATGTRTVRGMEAITLSIPPSPGRSVVKRNNNTGLFNIGTIFKEKGYKNVFFYGGDGYFDNMNNFFGGNGFDIVDRGRGYLMGDEFTSKRTNIEDDEVTFENAWGVCDEDIYRKVLKEADENFKNNQLFFNFIMTTSNHRPYTYPENKIAIPSGHGRDGAVEYTDFAIHDFLEKAKTKPWFSNTVFIIMADHCASSAGKQALDISKYHIPALIYNLKTKAPQEISTLCSQIDFFPTLFGYFNWDYTSQLLGRDISKIKSEDEFTFIANYRKMGFLKNGYLTVLNEQKSANFYQWNKENNQLHDVPMDSTLLHQTISYYQVSDYLYQNGLLKIEE
ncbi:MAG: sulfatase-like hydrolase/transferase [Vicingus serpentipes]|nr:sulfatase-like hydrolase/transferase [Vicingus serpentipes]